MLSNDNVSGVCDDEVLLRCADFRIFLLAACTMLATKRDELSLCESLELIAEMKDTKLLETTCLDYQNNLTFNFGNIFQKEIS